MTLSKETGEGLPAGPHQPEQGRFLSTPPAGENNLGFVPERLRRAVENFAELFVNRWDVYAWQKEDGSYICIQKPLTYEHLWRHLIGQTTLGVYSLDEGNRAKWLAFDADGDEDWEALVRLSGRLQGSGIPSYLERSRRGGHLWLFFEQPLAGKTARAFGKELLSWEEATTIEIFPKSEENRGGPGSLIRLPLGIHRRDGRRYPFVDEQGRLLGRSVQEQFEALVDVQRISPLAVAEVLGEVLSTGRKAMSRSARRATEQQESGLIARLKGLDLFEFVSAHVDLTAGGRGHCPFHDDDHMSFSVNREGNYWNCFAGCGGGDIIHFWEKWRGVSRGAAIRELAEKAGLGTEPTRPQERKKLSDRGCS